MTKFKVTMDNSQIFPKNAPSWIALTEIQSKFPAGFLAPYNILLSSKAGNADDGAVLTDDCFATLSSIVNSIVNSNTGIFKEDIISVEFFDGTHIPLNLSLQLLQSNSLLPFAAEYTYLFNLLTNPSNSSTYIQITPPFEPLGDKASSFTSQLRDIISQVSLTSPRFDIYLSSEGSEVVDAFDTVMHYFPYVIIITSSVIFLGIGLVFRSVFFPVRLVFSIATPLAAVYGSLWLVFGEHVLSSLIPSLNSVVNIYFLCPVMCFSIVVGLALDYDLFLYSRIVEYRQQGFTTRSSIILGMGHTGGIITAAGIIMAIAFGGLMLSATVMLQEVGFMLALSVLVDTFLIRTILVPAMIYILDDLNWWPMRMATFKN